MAILQSSDYNQTYFEGGIAGSYPLRRWFRNIAGFTGTGEYYRDRALALFLDYDLFGKKVLDIGCGFGFLVEDLRSWGVDAYGIDFSEYAVSVANSPYVTQAEAVSHAKSLKVNEYDLITMCGFLNCLSDDDIAQFVKNVGKKAQDFFILEWRDFSPEALELYNPKTLEEWQAYFPNVQIVWKDEEEIWQQSR